MASGNTLCFFGAQANQPPAAAYATFDLRNSQLVLEFDDSTAESAVFRGVFPRNYAGSGITVTLFWCADTATANDTVWAASIERGQDNTDTVGTDSFAAEQTATETAPGTAGIIAYTPIAFTAGAQMDSLAVGEVFRIKVRRNATSGSDTMVGDAQLIGVEIRET